MAVIRLMVSGMGPLVWVAFAISVIFLGVSAFSG